MTLPARCLGCGYVLTGLVEPRCPECGRGFDPHNPSTYSTKPLFARWKFWLPGFLLATVPGVLIYVLLLWVAGWGVAVSLVAPFCVGAILGYGCRVRTFVMVLLALAVVGIVVCTLFTLSFVGIFCGTALATVMLGPILFGTLCGFVLRTYLKGSDFEQRPYLPALLLLLAAVLWGVIERFTATPHAIESVVTSVQIPAPVGQTWNTVMFYEEVRHRPPWLLRYGLPRPLYARGSVAHVGDTKTCVYTKGHLTKRVTQRIPEQLLAFDVIEQDRIETHSVRLTDGSFAFEADGPRTTRVELTTRYQPKLGPRWVWRPFETWAVHTLHGYVLEGMAQRAVEEAQRVRDGTDGSAASSIARGNVAR
ncbi:MAG TPA: SRPBCC family protein [Tepidisphaeraceae bacterium]